MTTRIPINTESGGSHKGDFEERQKKIWEDMEADMDRRRREWEQEIEKMRKEFFLLRPHSDALGIKVGDGEGAGGAAPVPPPVGVEEERLGPQSRLVETSSGAEESPDMVVKDEQGNPIFRVVFDVHEYRPEEVSVKMDAHKVTVAARHQAEQGGSSVSRQYNREVRIPNQLDPLALQCLMGSDGILTVEAPLPASAYAVLKDTSAFLPINMESPTPSVTTATTPLVQSSSSSSSSYKNSYPPPSSDPVSSSFQPDHPESGLPPSDPILPPYQPHRPEPLLPSYRRPDPVLPSGFKSVFAPVQNCSPVMTPASSSSFASSQQPQQISSAFTPLQTYQNKPGPELTGFSVPSPPFQSLYDQQTAPDYSSALNGGVGGRMSSPEVSSDPGKFKLEVDIEDFKPEELTVKTQDRRVVVCARREEKVGNRSSTREMSREHMIPESVDPLTIKAFFTDGGRLVIEAPYRETGLLSQVTGR